MYISMYPDADPIRIWYGSRYGFDINVLEHVSGYGVDINVHRHVFGCGFNPVPVRIQIRI
jgi:hypothetical protein